ncbi:MAG: DUF4347 domain-containing protein, partial [Magnetococcales bacterium]|nr:DUF4347 domain-containing protein [Magnetococcales bacterium]
MAGDLLRRFHHFVRSFFHPRRMSGKPAIQTPGFLALESRLMFDASPFLVAHDGIFLGENPGDSPSNDHSENNGDRLPFPPDSSPRAPLTTQSRPTPEEVVFVDSSVSIPASWLEKEQAAVVTLTSGKDGLAEMTRYLADREGIQTIHVFSHGEPGAIELGTTRLSRENLDARAAEIGSWKDALTADGDILLYGCNVGQSQEGMMFLSRLSTLTGADVAASTDLTGSANRGGNWTLEATTGVIDANVAVDARVGTFFDGTLATITVTSNLDSGDFDGTVGGVTQVTLREALSNANNDNNSADSAANAGSGTDTITFDPSLSGTTITLSGSQLTISSSLTIDGDLDDDGTPDITIDGNGDSRIISVSSGTTVSLHGLILTHGDIGSNNGGAIRNLGDLSIFDCTITDNAGDLGAGIYNNGGTLLLQDSTVSLNTGVGDGAGIYNNAGTLTITDSTISQNSLGNDQGAGVYSKDGILTISGSTFSDNTTNSYGGGLYIDNSTTTITTTTFTGNEASRGGGMYINDNNPVDLVSVTMTGNTASLYGGGIYNLGTDLGLTGSTITGNFASSGTAIYTASGAQTESTTSTVDDVAGSGTFTGSWTPILDLDDSSTADNHFSATFTEGASAINVTDTDVVITDPDSTNLASVTLILTNRPDTTAETLSVNGSLPGGITVSDPYDNADGQMILSGVATIADYQTALTQIVYNNSNNHPDTTNRLVTISVSDGVNSSATAQCTIAIVRTNDAPSFSGLGATLSTAEEAQGVVIDGDATVSDAELDLGTFNGATLRLERNAAANSEDLFATSGNLSFSGSDLVWNGTTVGSVTTNGGGTLLLTFNALATQSVVGSVLQNLTYQNSSEVPPSSVTIDITLNDGNGTDQGSGGSLSVTQSVVVSITAVNDIPVFSGLNGTPTFTEGGSAVVLDGDVTVADLELDSTTYEGATLQLARTGGGNSDDQFSTTGNLAISGSDLTWNGTTVAAITSNSGGTLALQFNGNATTAMVASVMQNLTYFNISD